MLRNVKLLVDEDYLLPHAAATVTAATRANLFRSFMENEPASAWAWAVIHPFAPWASGKEKSRRQEMAPWEKAKADEGNIRHSETSDDTRLQINIPTHSDRTTTLKPQFYTAPQNPPF